MTDEIRHSTNLLVPGLIPGLGEMGKRQREMQKVLLDTIEDLSRIWLARAQSEVNLAFELASSLATARSIPEVAAANQDCLSRQLEISNDDGRRVFADGDELLRAGVRAISDDLGVGLSS